jgi:hypothetical protein
MRVHCQNGFTRMLPGVMGAKDEEDQLVDGYSSSGHKLKVDWYRFG